MTDRRRNRRLKPLRTCFLRGYAGSNIETRVTVIGHNFEHEKRLVEQLIQEYGWALGHDMELLPTRSFVERSVA